MAQCCSKGYEMEGIQSFRDIKEAVKGKDIICTDSLPANILGDFDHYQITKEIMDMANENVILNPCPPFYRGEELSEDVIDSDYFVGCAGDFVINRRSDRRGSSGISPLDGSVSLINIVLKPRKGTSYYYHYLLRSHKFIEEFYHNGRGIVADLWTTRYSEMRIILVPYPSELPVLC